MQWLKVLIFILTFKLEFMGIYPRNIYIFHISIIITNTFLCDIYIFNITILISNIGPCDVYISNITNKIKL